MSRLTSNQRTALMILVLGNCCIFGYLFYLVNSLSSPALPEIVQVPTLTGTNTQGPSPTATQTQSPTPTMTPVPTSPSFEQLLRKHENMTDAQWSAYRRELEGHVVVGWRGWVEDVEEPRSGMSRILVDMDSPQSLFSVQDVYLDLPSETAIELRRDQLIIFSGRIDSVNDFLGCCSIYLADAYIGTPTRTPTPVGTPPPTATPTSTDTPTAGPPTLTWTPGPPTSTWTPRPTNTPDPYKIGLSLSFPAKKGLIAVADNGVAIAVLRSIRPADDIVANANIFNSTPGAGKEYVLVEIGVGYKGSGSTTVSPAWDFALVGSENRVYDAKLFEVIPNPLESVELYFNGSATGNLLFEVPKSDSNLVIRYDPGFLQDERWLSIEPYDS